MKVRKYHKQQATHLGNRADMGHIIFLRVICPGVDVHIIQQFLKYLFIFNEGDVLLLASRTDKGKNEEKKQKSR